MSSADNEDLFHCLKNFINNLSTVNGKPDTNEQPSHTFNSRLGSNINATKGPLNGQNVNIHDVHSSNLVYRQMTPNGLDHFSERKSFQQPRQVDGSKYLPSCHKQNQHAPPCKQGDPLIANNNINTDIDLTANTLELSSPGILNQLLRVIQDLKQQNHSLSHPNTGLEKYSKLPPTSLLNLVDGTGVSTNCKNRGDQMVSSFSGRHEFVRPEARYSTDQDLDIIPHTPPYHRVPHCCGGPNTRYPPHCFDEGPRGNKDSRYATQTAYQDEPPFFSYGRPGLERFQNLPDSEVAATFFGYKRDHQQNLQDQPAYRFKNTNTQFQVQKLNSETVSKALEEALENREGGRVKSFNFVSECCECTVILVHAPNCNKKHVISCKGIVKHEISTFSEDGDQSSLTSKATLDPTSHQLSNDVANNEKLVLEVKDKTSASFEGDVECLTDLNHEPSNNLIDDKTAKLNITGPKKRGRRSTDESKSSVTGMNGKVLSETTPSTIESSCLKSKRTSLKESVKPIAIKVDTLANALKKTFKRKRHDKLMVGGVGTLKEALKYGPVQVSTKSIQNETSSTDLVDNAISQVVANVVKSSGRISTSPYATSVIRRRQTGVVYAGFNRRTSRSKPLGRPPSLQKIDTKLSSDTVPGSSNLIQQFNNKPTTVTDLRPIQSADKSHLNVLTSDNLPSLESFIPSGSVTPDESCILNQVPEINLFDGFTLTAQAHKQEAYLINTNTNQKMDIAMNNTLSPGICAASRKRQLLNRGTRFFGRRKKKFGSSRRYIKWTREKMIEADAWIEEAIRRQRAKNDGTAIATTSIQDPHNVLDGGGTSQPSAADIGGAELSLLNVKNLSEILDVSLSSIYKYLRLTRPDYEGGVRKSLVSYYDKQNAKKNDVKFDKNVKRGRPPGLIGKDVEICEEIKKIVANYNASHHKRGPAKSPQNTSFIEDGSKNVIVVMSVTDVLRRLPPRLRCSRISLKKYLAQLDWYENRSRRNALTACNDDITPCHDPQANGGDTATNTDGMNVISTVRQDQINHHNSISTNDFGYESMRPMKNMLSSRAPPSLLNIPNFYSNLKIAVPRPPVQQFNSNTEGSNVCSSSQQLSSTILSKSINTLTTTPGPRRMAAHSSKSTGGGLRINIDSLIAQKQNNGLLLSSVLVPSAPLLEPVRKSVEATPITSEEDNHHNNNGNHDNSGTEISVIQEIKKEYQPLNQERKLPPMTNHEIMTCHFMRLKLQYLLDRNHLGAKDIVFGGTVRLRLSDFLTKLLASKTSFAGALKAGANNSTGAEFESIWTIARSNAFVTVLMSKNGLLSYTVSSKELDPRADVRTTVINTRECFVTCIDQAFQRYSLADETGKTQFSTVLMLDEAVYDALNQKVFDENLNANLPNNQYPEDVYGIHCTYICPTPCRLSIKSVAVSCSKIDILPEPYPLIEFFRHLRTEVLRRLSVSPPSVDIITATGISKSILNEIHSFLERNKECSLENFYSKLQGF